MNRDLILFKGPFRPCVFCFLFGAMGLPLADCLSKVAKALWLIYMVWSLPKPFLTSWIAFYFLVLLPSLWKLTLPIRVAPSRYTDRSGQGDLWTSNRVAVFSFKVFKFSNIQSFQNNSVLQFGDLINAETLGQILRFFYWNKNKLKLYKPSVRSIETTYSRMSSCV